LSQSPSLRGSGRFKEEKENDEPGLGRLNPLHCGAVVASRRRGGSGPDSEEGLNPLHCGAVVASMRRRNAPARKRQVSIPFIAGQWSLRAAMTPPPALRRTGLNPLHCGAVVASWCESTARAEAEEVSIPFIAGQWSLRSKEEK